MAILTGKPSSISANTTSSTITLSTTDLLTLIDSATVDPYWKDAARIKSVSFLYRNSSRQKVSLKFTLPSTSSTISISENARNGALTCEKITVIGKANDILVIPRASFTTASEFDMAVTNGYSSSSVSGVTAITWADPITSAASTYVAELDGGIYKNGGPFGPSAAYDLLLKSTQELNSSEGYIEIDATLYALNPLNSTYSYGYAVGINSGSRGTSGNYDQIDFAVVCDNAGSQLSYFQNGIPTGVLPQLQSPQYSPGGGGMPTQTSFQNKIRIQLKNNNVEFFLNNIKYDTLVGALASINYPIFAEVSLKNPYIEGQPTIGSGFPSSRINSSISNPGTVVRSVDFTEVSEDPYSYPNMISTGSGNIMRAHCTRVQGSYIEFAQGDYMGTPTQGESYTVKNIGAYAYTGDASFNFPLVEGNNYIVRLHIDTYTNAGSNPSISVFSNVDSASDIVTISSSSIANAVGSYVDVLYTPSVHKYTMPPSPVNPNPSPMPLDGDGVLIISNNTDASNIIRISKIEFIEA